MNMNQKKYVKNILALSILSSAPIMLNTSMAQESVDASDPLVSMIKKIGVEDIIPSLNASNHISIDAKPEVVFYHQIKTIEKQSDVITYKLISAPEGAVVGESSGLLLWHPSSADVGFHTFQVHVERAGGEIDQKYFTVNVDENANTRPNAVAALSPAAMETLTLASSATSTESRVGDAPWQAAMTITPHPLYSLLEGAQWISANGWGNNSTANFRTLFSLPDNATPVSLSLDYYADNVGTVFFNGQQIAAQPRQPILENFQAPASAATANAAAFVSGVNELRIDGYNFSGPAGLAYSGTVNYLSSPMLDASNSYDADGDKLTYSWRVVEPAGKKSNPIVHSFSPITSFTESSLSEYELELTVSDGQLNNVTTIKVSGQNIAPVAQAHVLKNKDSSDVFELNANESFDAEDKPLNYHWRVIAAPEGAAVSIDNANQAQVSVVPDVAGLYAFELVVDDGELSSSPTLVFLDSSK